MKQIFLTFNEVDPVLKFLANIFLTLSLFFFSNYFQYILMVFLVLIFIYLKTPKKNSLFKIWFLFIILVLINFILNLIFPNGKIIFRASFIAITKTNILVSTRLFLFLLFAQILILTTDIHELSIGIGNLINKISFKKIPANSASIALFLTLKFIVGSKESFLQIRKAIQTRAIILKGSSLLKTLYNYSRLMLPWIIITLKNATRLALVLEAKGFGNNQIILKEKNKENYLINLLFIITIIIIYLVCFSMKYINILN
mgnify:CR=1 FL=1